MIDRIIYKVQMFFFPDFCYRFLRSIDMMVLEEIVKSAKLMQKENGYIDYEKLANDYLRFLR